MFWERLEVCIKHFWKNQLSGIRFDKTFIIIFNKHAAMKKKLVRANQAPYLTKAYMTKAIMRRSELQAKYFKLKTNDTLKAYKNRRITASDYTRKKEKKIIWKFESVICCWR